MTGRAVFLVEPTTAHQEGAGEIIELDDLQGRLLQITLGIEEVVEQESLDVQIYGSSTGATWTVKPLAAFPQKFYLGVSTIFLDLAKMPDLRYVQARWKMARWGRGSLEPKFRFYVVAQG